MTPKGGQLERRRQQLHRKLDARIRSLYIRWIVLDDVVDCHAFCVYNLYDAGCQTMSETNVPNTTVFTVTNLLSLFCISPYNFNALVSWKSRIFFIT